MRFVKHEMVWLLSNQAHLITQESVQQKPINSLGMKSVIQYERIATLYFMKQSPRLNERNYLYSCILARYNAQIHSF